MLDVRADDKYELLRDIEIEKDSKLHNECRHCIEVQPEINMSE